MNLDHTSTKTPSGRVCPYLGILEDPETHYGFPQSVNHCYRNDLPFPVSQDHQANKCLSENYVNCEIYPDTWQGKLPREISAGPIRRSRLSPIRIILLVLSVVTLGLVGFAYWNGMLTQEIILDRIGLLQPQPTSAPTFTPVFELDSTPTEISMLLISSPTSIPPTQTPSPTITVLPTITPTVMPGTPTPGPALATPFGPDGKYVVYKITAGESPNRIASDYQTTIEVIRAINQLPDYASIFPDTIFVIIPGEQDPSSVPQLLAIFTEEIILVDTLAEEYGVSPDQIRDLNGLGPEVSIPAGRWLVLPANPG